VPESLICVGCTLLCDDVTTDGRRLEPECALGTAWLADRSAPAADAPDATVAGAPADRETAVARAAQLLRAARRPLVHGFAEATIEDARAAVTLADRLGAIVAIGAPVQPWPGAPAFPLRGSSTATLGEIRDRSQLVIVWHEDPETTHPRLLQRLGFGADGSPTRVDGSRTLVVIDDRDTATVRRADLALDWPEDRDIEALAELFERFDGVRHATIVYGAALATGAGGQRRELALHELVRRLSHGRHLVTLSLAGTAGIRSADDVLAWQTGYSGTVDLASGHPELVTVIEPLIDHERIDLALCIEDDPREGVPTIVLSHRADPVDAEVWIRTAPVGVAASGTVHRLDGVPLTLRPPRSAEAGTPAAPTAIPTAAPTATPTAAAVLADLLKATDI
jgi:formylmethanofuran dehydrogenase subunit B